MKRKVLFAIAAAGCLSLMTACSSQAGADNASSEQTSETEAADDGSEEAYHKITAKEAQEMIYEGNVVVVDVRTQNEYDQEHIRGAILVPNESIGDEAPDILSDKDEVLLLYCRTGVRSKEAADKLVELGYKNVYDFGGIVDWPYETVRASSGGS